MIMKADILISVVTLFLLQCLQILGPLPDDVTHVILESNDISSKQLEKKLNCESILPGVFIVHKSWLIECVLTSSCIDESHHLIKINGDAGPEVSVNTAATSSSSASSCVSSSDDMSRKKQKTDSSEGRTPSNLEASKYPMIPNPIFFSDFEPVYDSWQIYRSTMYKFIDRKKECEKTGENPLIQGFVKDKFTSSVDTRFYFTSKSKA
jgi:hypothetical protein